MHSAQLQAYWLHFGILGKILQFFYYFYFISIFILLTRRKATEALIHRVSNYPDKTMIWAELFRSPLSNSLIWYDYGHDLQAIFLIYTKLWCLQKFM